MAEYKIFKNQLLCLGLMNSKIETNLLARDGRSSINASITKYAFEYYYLISFKDKPNFKLGLNLGFSFTNNSSNDYSAPPSTFFLLDSVGKIQESNKSEQVLLNNFGSIATIGLRFSKYKKTKEKFSIGIVYDYGFTGYFKTTNSYYYNYSKNYLVVNESAKGDQVKIYFSFPIKILK